ncbi:MAG: ATP-binding region ATPase domain protein [Sphingobacteriales bacterium]|nr:ATP-binding region ATPase domain protein [Sphingobacteriales bacterium]
MNTAIKRNLQIGFFLSLIILIISSVASYITIDNLLSSSDAVNHTHNVILELDEIWSIAKDAETGQRGFLLTNDENFLDRYHGADEKLMQSLATIRNLTSDNPTQQKKCDQLQVILTKRLAILKQVLDIKKAKSVQLIDNLLLGKKYMDETGMVISDMKSIERHLLEKRIAARNKYAGYAPWLIIIAAILSIILAILFYLKVINDFEEKSKLQQELENNSKDLQNRINIIKNLAEQISEGNYGLRINRAEKDGLGILANSLDKMANSLHHSFKQLNEKEWMQTGIARLNEIMVGEKDIQVLTNEVLEFLAFYTQSQVGALYLIDNDKLHFKSGFAFQNIDKKEINKGEGISGQCALSGKQILVNNLNADDIIISYASGEIKPHTIVAEPIFYDSKVKGVIELATTGTLSNKVLQFLAAVTQNIGIAINSAETRKKQIELLEETQAQSEELQAQHYELENLNSELGIQTQKIQASEEELRVQQEELLQSNRELEERSTLLEEKNQLILERNLQIQEKAEQLEWSTKYKSEFLANMSHELRTPLNSILLLSRLMTENVKLEKEQIEYANVIQSAGQGLLTLIDEILDLSQIESGKMNLNFEEMPVTEIASNMKALFEPVFRDKKLDLQIQIEPGLPATIETDKLRLEQIIKNLLSNALKFTKDGYVRFKVSQPESDKSLILFSVKDSGIGISEDKQNLIFEAFKQADGTTRRKFGGTGLGLSISKELARLLGGQIKLVSKLGEGSEFILIVPIKKPSITISSEPIAIREKTVNYVKQKTIIEPEQASAERYISAVIPNDIADDRYEITPDDRIILIVEDETLFAKALLQYTRKQGYKGIVVVRGDEAVPVAIKFHPTAILLDIQLPVKDGWEIMEELKANIQTRHIPIHIMSSMQVKNESLLKGAVDYFDKPIAQAQMNEMFKKLEHVWSKHPKKVLIIEENLKHATALHYFLGNYKVNSVITSTIVDATNLLNQSQIDCVILDTGLDDQDAYETLPEIKKKPGLENLPIIVFTGKNLSKTEESRMMTFADSIIVKTAHSYKRILDEVGLFLHVVQENSNDNNNSNKALHNKIGGLTEVLKNKTVLIADDDVRNIFSLTKALEMHNMQVVSAIDGVEALAKLEENPQIDIILMDMMMPELDGYETIVQIRSKAKYKQLPILAITAKAMKGDREKCIQAGASDYISKPVDIDQLTSLLRVWLYDKNS